MRVMIYAGAVIPLLKFSLARLSFFFAAAAVTYSLSKSPFMAIAGGWIVSAILAYIFLDGPRQEAAGAVQKMLSRKNAEIDSEAAAEDAADEATRQNRSE